MSTGDPQRSIKFGAWKFGNQKNPKDGMGKCEENLPSSSDWGIHMPILIMAHMTRLCPGAKHWSTQHPQPSLAWHFLEISKPRSSDNIDICNPNLGSKQILKSPSIFYIFYTFLYISIESSKIIPFYFFGLRNPDLRCRSPGEAAPGGM